MAETLNKPENPNHFSEVHHENGEALMCMSSGGECRVLVEVMAGYSPEEEQQLIASITSALEAIDQFTGGRAADIFTGLHIKIGEDVAEGGAKAVAEENQVLLNGRKTLLSVAEMKQISGAYSDEELAGFPDEHRPGGALEYTLVHEMGHVLDGQTKTGEAYHRAAASESPTKYGREADQWHSDNKDHEAFAEGFAHAVYGMSISEKMEMTVRETIESRSREVTKDQVDTAETTNEDRPEIAETVKLMERLHAAEVFSTPEQSKKFLDSLSYDDFKKWISLVNGVERGIPRAEYGQVSDSRIQSENPLLGAGVEYQPPSKNYRDKLLKMAFDKAQSVDDAETAALTLGLSINAIHYFEDGNGRTARMAYALLARGYNGSQEDQVFYSSLLENTKGREVVNPNPTISGIDDKIRSEMFAQILNKTGFAKAFGDIPPTDIHDGYPNAMAGEYSPAEIAAGDEIDQAGRLMLYRTMESGGLTMTSLVATFGPDRIKDHVRVSPNGKRSYIDGNTFLPTLTQEEIQKWWNNSERAIAGYVRRLINVADRDDVAGIAAHYKSQIGEALSTPAP